MTVINLQQWTRDNDKKEWSDVPLELAFSILKDKAVLERAATVIGDGEDVTPYIEPILAYLNLYASFHLTEISVEEFAEHHEELAYGEKGELLCEVMKEVRSLAAENANRLVR